MSVHRSRHVIEVWCKVVFAGTRGNLREAEKGLRQAGFESRRSRELKRKLYELRFKLRADRVEVRQLKEAMRVSIIKGAYCVCTYQHISRAVLLPCGFRRLCFLAVNCEPVTQQSRQSWV